MFNLFVLTALLAVTSAHPSRLQVNRGFNGRIVNGYNITIEEAPYQISLQFDQWHKCGGSIISDYWVLTARHCLTNAIRYYTVRAGSTFHNNGGSLHKVAEIITYEKSDTYRNGNEAHDIGLVRVEEPFVFDETRRPIALYEANEKAVPDAISIVTGWGTTLLESPLVLQAVQVPIVSKRECYDDYMNFGGISETEICAGYPEGGKDACQGDSGGPLVIDGRQAGIVSRGFGCAEPGKPGIYAEVASHREWIKAHSGV